MRRLYLIRHAASRVQPGSIVGRWDVEIDPPAAAAVVALKARLPADAPLISSPARRCQQTAQALGYRPEQLEPRLWEQDFGAWDRHQWQDLNLPPQHAFWQAPAYTAAPQGESFAQVCARAGAWLNSGLLDTPPYADRPVVVLAHKGSLLGIIGQVLGLRPHATLKLQLAPFSLSVVQDFGACQGENRWSLESLNQSFDASQ